uniref:Uncharacterized protein n=1 Tax=Mola mola TaxID=94237 RepID=A0A3Q3WUH6_MOLML
MHVSSLSLFPSQRKRHRGGVKCAIFPDDVKDQFQRGGREPSSLSSVCSAKSWEKCGDSFGDTSVIQVHRTAEQEISGYRSDAENIGQPVTSSNLGSESCPLQNSEGSKRSVSDWVRSAQAMLQTPQKPIDGQCKTPEDSAKKKRKFQSGGLAERLNKLQRRQRSAVSFWRHQSLSDTSAVTGDPPGVLVLEVLEVLEECSMQLARCEHRQPPGEGHRSNNPISEEKARVLVLFSRETAAYLIPNPTIISINLCPFPSQVAALGSLSDFGCFRVLARHCHSLLEVIEGLGQAGSVKQDVEVVVQRVYSITVCDSNLLNVKYYFISHSLPPRLCVLVQDSYGMFSVVQLHLLPCKDDLHQYCHLWQGRTCVLRGIKVVQRVTRERRTRLFSLIDSLWPPVMPVKDHGNMPSMSSVSSYHSKNHAFPGVGVFVHAILNPFFSLSLNFLFLFQGSDVGQGEVWLVLTDPSLQEEQPERPCKRTVALCVNTSCVLTSSVLGALNSPAASRMSFRDAIKEHGNFTLCSADPEGSHEPPARPESLSQSLSEPQANTLPQPVRLDPLSPEITPNSLCSVTGVIIGVDENTAYSWPECNHCGSNSLEMIAGRLETFHCVTCKSVVDRPNRRIQLEVFLSSSFSNCTLKVQVRTASYYSEPFPGYDVENVLGKEVGPIAVYVRVVTRKPALWIGLEEISL